MRKIIVFCVLTLCAFLLFIGLHSFLRISSISIAGADSLEGIAPFYKKNLLFVQIRDVEMSIINNNPNVESAQVTKHFPHEIKIIVVTVKPVAKVKLVDGYMSVSSKGRILTKQRENMLSIPLEITHFEPLYYQNFIIGEQIEIKELSDSLEFIREINKLALAVSKVDIQNENMILLISKEGEIRFSSTKNIKEQVAQLISVLEQMRIQSREFSRIDVRFDKPVVVFK